MVKFCTCMRCKSERYDAMEKALRELYATVKGECPSLLNEDSGGNAQLDLDIQAILDQVSASRLPSDQHP